MDRTTDILTDYACNLTYEDLSPEAVKQVKRTLIDTLGCAAGGFLSEPGKIARSMASSVSSDMPARILGTDVYSSPDMAGFANGVMVRYLDCNDCYFSPGGGHPSDMIPAVLALADPMAAGGKDIITAIVLAYEVFCRLSDEVLTGELGWDQGMFSVIGAACAAGKIMELDKNQMANAISLAVAPSLPLGVTRTGELSMWKGCATASATRSAIFAALLAGQGMTGPSEPFEGKRGLWEQAVGRQVQLGAMGGGNEPFRITDSFFKAYPAQIHTQAPTGLALELQPLVSSKEIESIRIHAYRSACSTPATEPTKWDPKTRESADHSIPYMVAVAFLDGGVSPASFTSQKISDPGIRELISKITIEENEEYTGKYPGEYNIRMEVSDRSGKTHAAHTSFPKGHQNNPLSDEELEAKFRGLSSGVWSDGQSAAALELIWALEDLTSLDELMDGLVV
ncbi:MAG: MmgE/PrpD family protein [Chloroflexi bacterium]|nr:MmgE/PrpD family protein [Chloroflexota bacterium]